MENYIYKNVRGAIRRAHTFSRDIVEKGIKRNRNKFYALIESYPEESKNKIKTHLAELGTIEDDVIIFVLQLLDDLEMLKKQCLLSKFPELLGTIFVTPYEKLEDSVSENILKEYSEKLKECDADIVTGLRIMNQMESNLRYSPYDTLKKC